MDKIKKYFLDLWEQTKAVPKKAKVATVDWFVLLYTWIIHVPKSIQKWGIRNYNNIKNLPTNIKKKIKEMKGWTLKEWVHRIGKFFLNRAILFALLIIIIAIGIMNENFFTARTVSNILTTSSYRLLFAVGVGTIIVGKGTDLSIGRVVGFATIIGGIFSQDVASNPYVTSVIGNSPFVVILLTMVIGMAFGFLNGFVVTKFRVDPFIATLGMMLIAYGGSYLVTQQLTKGATISGFSMQYKNVVNETLIDLGGIQITAGIILSIVLAIFMWILWNKTPIGKKIFATGGNKSAALVSGIKVKKVLMFTYVIAGAYYGIGASLLTWYTGAVSPETATMYELDAIAACIVGGLSFDGGRGKISGIVIGVVIFECITLGFGMIGMDTWMIYLVKGLIIIAAIAFDMIKVRKKK